MRAYVISLGDGAETIASSRAVGNPFEVELFRAVPAAEAQARLSGSGRAWTWPWDAPDVCPITGLRRHPYTTSNRDARIACFLSHELLWRTAAHYAEPVIVLEDDALFTRRIDPDDLPTEWAAIGLNDPRGATRRAGVYHDRIKRSTQPVAQAPWVDDDRKVPQGLAGASAYIIRPHGANAALNAVARVGAWPNDAILCRQLVPKLGQLADYATRVAGRRSTLA